jgi:hypothetical protein
LALQKNGKVLLIAVILQMALILAVIIYGTIIYISVPDLGIAIYPPDDLIITTVAMVLAIVSIAVLILSYLWPRILKNARPRNNKLALTFWSTIMPNYQRNTLALSFSVFIVRASLFESVAICGLILGILGARWQITLPFLVVSLMALILSFPTGARWDKMAEKLNVNKGTGFPLS